MSLDLDEVLDGWTTPVGEVAARLITGRTGEPLVQLRIDLGLLQMSLEGRPDGKSYRDRSSALEYLTRELDGRRTTVTRNDWDELSREFLQSNYRRVALSHLAEERLSRGDTVTAREMINRAIRDVEHCLRALDLHERAHGDAGPNGQQRPTLVFNGTRLRTQLHVVEGRYDDAIEELRRGRDALEALLCELGLESEQRESDPGIEYLNELERRIREQYGVSQTLRERLEAAIEDEDFEAAAAIRDEMRRRQSNNLSLPAPPEDRSDS
ncbi:MAG: hypothetical protein CHACPFDD_01070 [Phycisphaerae bacterium]|nr:hypothetical protein [Phycisphaerae bacterium]